MPSKSDQVVAFLEQRGPCRSSEVAAHLTEGGVSPAAARQQVSRAIRGGYVERLTGITLPNREAFIYLREQRASAEFRPALCGALISSNSAFGRALIALNSRGGAIDAAYFPIASGLPSRPAIGQLLHNFVAEKLQHLKLIHQLDLPDGDVIATYESVGINARRRAHIAIEDILLPAILDWITKLGWMSTHAKTMRSLSGELPMHGQFAWDFVGPSYLSSIVTRGRGQDQKNGFIVGDILWGSSLSLADIQPFLSKWDCLQSQQREIRFQPVLIAESLTQDALFRLRHKGCIVAMPSTLFGEDVARDLRGLASVVERAAVAVADDPSTVFGLVTRLSKLEGAALNLRGVAFELMIAHLLRATGHEAMLRHKIATSRGERAEIDVKAIRANELVLCECKGKAPSNRVEHDELNEWCTKKLPRILSWLHDSDLPPKRRIEFYASTEFSPQAADLAEKISKLHRKVPVSFHTGSQLMQRMKDDGQQALVEIFREQFIQ